MKTKTKIVLFLASIFSGYTLLFSVFIYFAVARYSYTDFFKRLELRAVTTAKIELENLAEDVNTIREFRKGYLETLPNEQSYIFEIATANLQSQAQNIGVNEAFLTNIINKGADNIKIGPLFFSGVVYNANNKEYVSVVSAENLYSTNKSKYLKNLLLVSILIALTIIFGTSVWISKKILDPLKAVTNKVKSISSENMHLRLEVADKSDELSVLAKTFNDMLDRIETAFETQKNFISNASHELNTPLTSIIGEADVALSKIRNPEDYIESLSVILEEAEKLDKKTRALLLLARTGYNGKTQTFDKVRMDQLLLDVQETVLKINPKAKIHLDFSLLPESPTKLKVKGNEQLLHLAFSNVVLNGCKYSSNQDVQVSLGASQSEVIVIIKDKGVGIPAEELQFIYDPFFRASNTQNFDGYGIGLPLTRNVINIHGGEIIINSVENSGTTVEIKLPIGNYSI